MDYCPVTSKVRYASAADATLAVLNLQVRRRSGYAERSYYQCVHCRGWHVTSFHRHETTPRNKQPYQRGPRFRWNHDPEE